MVICMQVYPRVCSLQDPELGNKIFFIGKRYFVIRYVICRTEKRGTRYN